MNATTTRALGALLLTTTLASPLALGAPERPTTVQGEGFAWGALLGTLVAGPAGTVVGAGFGSLAGHGQDQQAEIERSHRQQLTLEQRLHATEQRLQTSQSRLTALESGNQELSRRLSEAQHRPQLEPLLGALTLDIHFRSNSAVVEPHYYPRLQALAEQVRQLPGLHLRLSGFADPRGSAAFNRNLSRQRVDALRQLLLDRGVAPDRLCAEFKGESEPLADPAQPGLYPFERRVELRFEFKGERS